MDIGIPELIIILLIVVLIFGGSRIAKLGGELGTAIRSFREGLADDEGNKPEAGSEADQEKDTTGTDQEVK